MDKLKMQSLDVITYNIHKIAQLFPQCVTERKGENGKTELGIDFEKLREELSDDVIDDGEERYQFTWPDKKTHAHLANTPITDTLRPCREESVDFDNTQNLYIEGDNLNVLKVLRETYLGKVKMIYIDPPYNTGNDFVYRDTFGVSKEDEEQRNGTYDTDGNLLMDKYERNTIANGRYHTDWLNMIYPRLKVAKDLLTEDGVIFISIDDNEQANLKKVCDEIFGEQNFVATLIWERAFSPKADAKFISNSHDYILMFARNILDFKIGRLPRTAEADARYSNPDNDPRGPWMSSDISVKTYNASSDYPITTPSGRVVEPPAGRCWSLSKNAFLERLQDNRIWFGPNGDNTPRIKRFLSELKFDGMSPTSILFHKNVGHSQEGTQEVVSLFGDQGVFDGPKPVRLLQRLITLANLKENSIVLDFFSGSATTAHALMKTIAEKGTQCRCVLVQLPEEVSKTKKAQGYNTICEIGKERIRRAGKKIKEDNAGKEGIDKLDIGFRVLKLDSSNMQDIYYSPQQFTELSLFADNVKPDRTEEDLLFQVMLELGVELSASIEQRIMDGKTVFFVNENYLVACFDTDIAEDTIKKIAQLKPYYFVIRDSSLASDNVADNIDQLFETYSKDTIRRIV